ncbi:uncharacterized protein LACBIDRAFT_313401 [Laccaria bicolor S238N-H82]|uniref:Predicted protein n=1 Tax=Laccaria bicolor (strain S238N-H82 / ATCC MYA-4686) TaxID=486041 RepID=B0DY85_LACBS|nr:uncharacterized protein LACBIDRAFT_313401 [Laccaria bicolor S238N-H82]EDR00480.1 predicted protein [Laccaria bicolor S238N-H82]|eukprot:XP_001888872.1 predicted protein [Laccaria bicolor S238N-H82]
MGRARPDNRFNRLTLKVLAPISIFTHHESFCSFWSERVLAPGTSTSSTATPFAGMNHVDAHLHDNLGSLSSSVCFHSSRNFTFLFQPEARSQPGSSISYIGAGAAQFVTCDHVIRHPSQSQCTP